MAQAIDQLRNSANTETPELDAQLLACHYLEINRSRLFAFPETLIPQDVSHALDESLLRRINAEPLAYITGTREFWSTDLHIAPGALVPRADTEILVEKSLELARLAPEGAVLDLGTGTGAIAIAIASELTNRQIIAIERSREALAVAHENIRAQAFNHLHLIQGCWLDAIADKSVAMLLTNPPYLASNDIHLEQLRHEPRDALVSGPTGLEDLEHIIATAVRVGKSGAPLILEHGCQQGSDVRQLLLNYNYSGVDTGLDLAGLERISFGFVA
ncbi:MAG: peptide chain release factor N(5)-glutamine methyltransferase [Granulosicoccus sp.]